MVSAWSRAENVSGDPDQDYSVYVDIRYMDGTHAWGRSAPFRTGSHPWERAVLQITPDKPVEFTSVYLLLRGAHTGSVWFDDVSLQIDGSTAEWIINGAFDGKAPAEKIRLDGLYLDSFEMGAAELNCRRAHFASADIPLVFDSRKRVCQLGHFLVMELAMKTAADIHAKGKLMFANSVLHTFPWPAGCLDIFGTETNWRRNGEYVPDSDETMLYWRAMCFKRPYLTLLNTHFEKFPHAWVKRYFQRCCAYGVLPSMFSPNGSGSTSYWVNPKFYNRDRDLFRKYIPVIRRIAQAGWAPIPWAYTGDEALWIERFGNGKDVYFTVFNSGKTARKVRLTVDVSRLFGNAGVTASRLLPTPGDASAVRDSDGKVRLAPVFTLRPEQVAVIRLVLKP